MLVDKIQKEDRDVVFVYTTCSSLEEAREIGYLAIEEKMSISADYWVVNSIYPWRKVIHETEQCILMLTTQKFLSRKLMDFIEAEHSYRIPAIIVSNSLSVNQSYLFWLEENLNSIEKYTTEEDQDAKKRIEDEDIESRFK